MSFNEECPTSYLGPEEGMTVINAAGAPVRMTRLQYLRMCDAGHLTDAQMLGAKDDAGVSLQDLLDEANGVRVIALDNITVDPVYAALFEHRSGCASSRGRDCNCEYLAQWDAADIPEPPVTEGCTRHYPEGGGYLDIPNHLTKTFLTGETS